MKKAHRKAPVMRRTSRIFLNDLNPGKAAGVRDFLHQCRDITQYFVDLFWQRQDFSADLADLETVHRGRDHFGITTRLAQALAKQAKELCRAAHANGHRKPRLRLWTSTLYSHFVTLEPFDGPHFDYALRLTGSGAPRLTLPLHSTRHLNRFLAHGWALAKTVRLGWRKGRLFIDILLEKARPTLRTSGAVVGMDSNYKYGLVFSDGQTIGETTYQTIQGFAKRQKQTYPHIKSLIGHALKQIDWSNIRILCIEDLKHVKQFLRGTFPRRLNRRLSHWLYAFLAQRLACICEEGGIRVEHKNPAYTSQYCRLCRKWDRRNRKGDRFVCVFCGHADHADLNAAHNLALLGLAGVYGLRSLQSSECQRSG
jgi:IS605 OrfB family transposase